jgi:hypothetical protein
MFGVTLTNTISILCDNDIVSQGYGRMSKLMLHWRENDSAPKAASVFMSTLCGSRS